MKSTIFKTIMAIFAVIGLLAVIGVLGMWAMHSSMMGAGGMFREMAAMCSSMMN